jgi:hypothetical protein
MKRNLSVATYKRRLAVWTEGVTEPEITAAEKWYEEATEHAESIAWHLDSTVEVAACVIAAFSPRTSWTRNLQHAYKYAQGGTIPGLRIWTVMADASLTQGFDALKGPKTNAFARNIAGDVDAVTIDVWMMRAAGLSGHDTPTVVQYRRIADAVRALAVELGMTPRGVQALIWLRIRAFSQREGDES